MNVEFGLFFQIATFLVMVGAAAVWLRSEITKQRSNEAMLLAETRGHRIDDLEEKLKLAMAEWEKERAMMRAQVAELQGQISQLQKVKTDEIVDGVTHGFRSILIELHEEGKLTP